MTWDGADASASLAKDRGDIRLEGASDHSVSAALYLRDPNDNGIELYWDHRQDAGLRTPEGGVAMFTRRLALYRPLGELETQSDAPLVELGPQDLRGIHNELGFASIALTHDTIDGILRLICCVKLSPRQSKCADIRSQFGALAAIEVLPTPLKTQLEKLWYSYPALHALYYELAHGGHLGLCRQAIS
jgi:hypothetical protein